MRRPRAFRIWALLWAVLQFALPAGASLADARLERDGGDARAHIEATSRSTCHPAHSDNCAVCQIVAQTATAPERPRCTEVARQLRLPVASTGADPYSRRLLLLAPARAPPVA